MLKFKKRTPQTITQEVMHLGFTFQNENEDTVYMRIRGGILNLSSPNDSAYLDVPNVPTNWHTYEVDLLVEVIPK